MNQASSAEAWHRFPPLRLNEAGGCLDLLDQTSLPFEMRRVQLATLDACAEAIRSMRVRGAPLIGLTGAGGLAVAALADDTDAALDAAARTLIDCRPTAVNLSWAVEATREALRAVPPGRRAAQAWSTVRALAAAEHDCCERIGEHGLALIRAAAGAAGARKRGRVQILTHCNAGWLATGAWGTATAPIYRAHRAGIPLHVWVDETRPRSQGARLTAWELAAAGIPYTLIADNAAGHLMQRGEVDLCLVGSDRTTAAGDVCNKIGTYQKALAAADNGVPFHVALPVSTFDWTIEDGLRGIPIEQRSADEVLWVEGQDSGGALRVVRVAAPGTTALNPAFDVTPARLVTSIVCEHGVFRAEPHALAQLRAVAAAAPARV